MRKPSFTGIKEEVGLGFIELGFCWGGGVLGFFLFFFFLEGFLFCFVGVGWLF